MSNPGKAGNRGAAAVYRGEAAPSVSIRPQYALQWSSDSSDVQQCAEEALTAGVHNLCLKAIAVCHIAPAWHYHPPRPQLLEAFASRHTICAIAWDMAVCTGCVYRRMCCMCCMLYREPRTLSVAGANNAVSAIVSGCGQHAAEIALAAQNHLADFLGSDQQLPLVRVCFAMIVAVLAVKRLTTLHCQ